MEIMIKENIVSPNGQLLIAKGVKISVDENKRRRYRQLGILHNIIAQSDLSNSKKTESPDQVVAHTLDDLEHKNIQFNNDHVIAEASDIIQNIIISSRDTTMGILIQILSKADLAWIYSHSVNTALLSTMASIVLDYDRNDTYDLAKNTLIHDIGMTLISKDVLNKKRMLTENDKREIASHCELGMAIVEEIDSLLVNSIIMQHHERLDGSGYPLGISGNEICHPARIVMVADALDSATTVRPYRPAKPLDQVFEELAGNDQKFDKEIVSVFDKLMRS